jgi:hypothetical protein
LSAKYSLLETGELSARHVADCHRTCKKLADTLGKSPPANSLQPADFESLRGMLARTRGPVSLRNERQPLYFEYEISPLGYELPILVPNMNGKFLGWQPWHYERDRKIRKATVVRGGDKKPNAEISGWTAEVFVPYQLLEPLANSRRSAARTGGRISTASLLTRRNTLPQQRPALRALPSRHYVGP